MDREIINEISGKWMDVTTQRMSFFHRAETLLETCLHTHGWMFMLVIYSWPFTVREMLHFWMHPLFKDWTLWTRRNRLWCKKWMPDQTGTVHLTLFLLAERVSCIVFIFLFYFFLIFGWVFFLFWLFYNRWQSQQLPQNTAAPLR